MLLSASTASCIHIAKEVLHEIVSLNFPFYFERVAFASERMKISCSRWLISLFTHWLLTIEAATLSLDLKEEEESVCPVTPRLTGSKEKYTHDVNGG